MGPCRDGSDIQKSSNAGVVAQVTDRGHSATSVAKRLGVSSKSLYHWVRQFGDTPDKGSEDVTMNQPPVFPNRLGHLSCAGQYHVIDPRCFPKL